MTIIGENPERYGFEVTPAPALEVERVGVDLPTDLRVISEQLDIPVERLQELNPQLLRWATPPDVADFELILPVGLAADFEEKVAPLAENERIRFRHHIVESGETVSHLAVRYGVSVAAISDANDLSGNRTIRIGQLLVIPISGMTFDRTQTAADSPPEIYRIRQGDTLSGIADRYGITIGSIRTWRTTSASSRTTGRARRWAPGASAGRSGATAWR
jgi:membrane-bound lytic murein transglycosylase D